MSSRKMAMLIRKSALEMVHVGQAAHIGSCLSVADILAVLYTGSARVTPEDWGSNDCDAVVVSKGHAAAAIYAALAHAGFFPERRLQEFCADGSPFSGHVTAGKIPGVEFSTGSLGHGLGFSSGLALAARLDGSRRRAFAILSDGECDEGSVWEAALIAGHSKLSNLTAIIDRNGLQSFGSTEDTLRLEPLAEKWHAFGWRVKEVDGHNHDEMRAAFLEDRLDTRPCVVIAHTVKGAGVSFMENSVMWHYRTPDCTEIETAIVELEAGYEE